MPDPQRMALSSLVELLAERYPDAASTRRIVTDAGLPTTRIAIDAHAANTWSRLLEAARLHEKLDDLLAVVLQDYPSLRGALDELRPALGL